MSSRARLNPRHQQMVREKIRASHIIRRFHEAFDGKIELTKSQIDVGNILLKKSLPDLQAIEHSGENGGPIKQLVEIGFVGAKDPS